LDCTLQSEIRNLAIEPGRSLFSGQICSFTLCQAGDGSLTEQSRSFAFANHIGWTIGEESDYLFNSKGERGTGLDQAAVFLKMKKP